ncbi:MAG TPA: hypothetical protein VES39_00405 [Rhodospirillales bacterium]|nr:hypothetical protein [Rhodospirillales bacterium]
MKQALALAAAAIASLIVASPSLAAVADEDCLKSLNAAAAQARKRIGVYQGELKGIRDNPNASNALSICNSAAARAEQYYKRNFGGGALCVAGSAYTDGQVVHLFKNATITCRAEMTSLLERLPPEEQGPISERIRRREGELR